MSTTTQIGVLHTKSRVHLIIFLTSHHKQLRMRLENAKSKMIIEKQKAHQPRKRPLKNFQANSQQKRETFRVRGSFQVLAEFNRVVFTHHRHIHTHTRWGGTHTATQGVSQPRRTSFLAPPRPGTTFRIRSPSPPFPSLPFPFSTPYITEARSFKKKEDPSFYRHAFPTPSRNSHTHMGGKAF